MTTRPDFGVEPRLPAIPDVRTAPVSDVISALREWVEVRQGARGDVLDRAVTMRDLLNAGLATPEALRNLNPGVIPPDGFPLPEADPAIPPTPTNLVATGAMKNIILTWDFARGYSRLAYFEVWRSLTDAIGDAELIGQTFAPMYADDVGPSAKFYYWVRAVSDAAASPFNALAGTLGATELDPVEVMKALLERLGYGEVDIENGVFPITLVDELPVLPDLKYPVGVLVFNLADGKLYRNAADAWTAAVEAADITGVITSVQIADDAITAPKIAANAITAAKILAGSVDTDKLAANAVTAGKLAAGAIVAGSAVIANGAIGSAHIANAAITNAKIGDLAVDNAKIVSMAVNKLTAGSLGVGEYIESTNFASGDTGFRIHANGSAEFNNVVARGTIYGTAGTIGNVKFDMTNGIWSSNYILDSAGFRLAHDGVAYLNDARIRGTLTAANGLFSVDINGKMTAKSGTTGARTETKSLGTYVYDSTGALRVTIGKIGGALE